MVTESDEQHAERLGREAEELAKLAVRQLYILIVAGFYLILTLAGPDSQLVRADATIRWPLIQTEVTLSTFLTYVPIALIGLLLYLHLFVERLIDLRRRGYTAPKTFIFEMTSPLARAVADVLLYAYVPLVLAWFSWKVVFRHEAPMLLVATLVVTFGSALVYYLRAVGGRSRARRWIGLAALTLFSVLSIGGTIFVTVWGTDPILRLRQIDLVRANLGTSQEFAFVNLAETRLNYADMSYARLSGADLRGTDLSATDLTSARIGTATTENQEDITNLEAANLSGARMLQADLRGASFACAVLDKTEAPQSLLGNTNFRGAILDGVDLTRAKTEGLVVFQEALLEEAKFAGAEIRAANFVDADLRRADFVLAKLEGTNFSNADLQSAKLTDAELTGAAFTGADLQSADLTWANLAETDFVGTNLTDADLKDAYGVVGPAAFESAHLCNTRMPGGDTSVRDCGKVWDEPSRVSACAIRPKGR